MQCVLGLVPVLSHNSVRNHSSQKRDQSPYSPRLPPPPASQSYVDCFRMQESGKIDTSLQAISDKPNQGPTWETIKFIGLYYTAQLKVYRSMGYPKAATLLVSLTPPHDCTDGVPPSVLDLHTMSVLQHLPRLGGCMQLEQKHMQLTERRERLRVLRSSPSCFYEARPAVSRPDLGVYQWSHALMRMTAIYGEQCSTQMTSGNTCITLGRIICKVKEFTFSCKG